VIAHEPVSVEELTEVEHVLARNRSAGAAGAVRATTLNLIVYAPSEEHVARTEQGLSRIGGSRPLRAIIARPADGPTTATVSSYCWMGSAAQPVCSEHIVLCAKADALPSAVLSLLVSDLLTFLWWQGPVPAELETVRDLAPLATRTLVDSAEAGLEGVIRLNDVAPSLTDLAWIRLWPWREAVAGLFDRADALAALTRLWGLEVRGPTNEGCLLAGWLRSQLRRHLGLDQSERSRLERVALRCGETVYAVERDGRSNVGHACAPDMPDHPVVLRDLDWAGLIGAALDRVKPDPIFQAALRAATADAA
jgi:glucose-6-phosphate dehydrogenase assembly protein OpcA